MNAFTAVAAALACCGLLAGNAAAQVPGAAKGGYSIFDGTMVDLNYQQFEEASKRGAILKHMDASPWIRQTR